MNLCDPFEAGMYDPSNKQRYWESLKLFFRSIAAAALVWYAALIVWVAALCADYYLDLRNEAVDELLLVAGTALATAPVVAAMMAPAKVTVRLLFRFVFRAKV